MPIKREPQRSTPSPPHCRKTLTSSAAAQKTLSLPLWLDQHLKRSQDSRFQAPSLPSCHLAITSFLQSSALIATQPAVLCCTCFPSQCHITVSTPEQERKEECLQLHLVVDGAPYTWQSPFSTCACWRMKNAMHSSCVASTWMIVSCYCTALTTIPACQQESTFLSKWYLTPHITLSPRDWHKYSASAMRPCNGMHDS